ncbi:MAG: hypothetical protein FAZ92_03572 [Accumulibacter sp.]|jgi:outer membrane protein OmpA-like peptidoglycan-associated protein|uniref:OmpA family protein n=1 Tax=Accumulibacter sp. TaxID=2053492 RepID=UPI001220B402|nr:OmpA family protein [Accumulibacter sp.]QKS30292.1 MAG: OmpA family protein [Candidatus Accumulibacter similis]TLD44179.1 MAG: hypothetical protein FAZ92_03572 [Accumulibacter sp.]
MSSGTIRIRRFGLTLLPLCCMLAGCTTFGQSPTDTVPPPAPGSSLTTDSPADEPPPARSLDSVESDPADNIYFARRVTHIDPAGQDKLRLHAARLKEHPGQVVYLAAYAEDLGSASYELAIANQRIEAVTKLLRNYGVARRQVHPLRRYGVARGRPAPACATTDCRDRKGRVVLSYGPR